MVAMRRSWSRRTLHRRAGGDGPAGAGAAFQVLDAIEGATAAGEVMTVNGVADALGVDQPRASRLVATAPMPIESVIARPSKPMSSRRKS